MPSSLPVITGDVLTADVYNSLVAFTVGADKTTDYTAVIGDSYQTLISMNKATAVAFKIPTDASANIPIGSVITVISKGAGLVTISAVTPGTTTINSSATVPASPTLAQWKSAACIKVAANSWIIVGGIS
jgi:hypothetical protein